jgi:serine/threonine-protein kinase
MNQGANDESTTTRRPARGLLRWILDISAVAAAIVAVFVLFNYVVMPALVRQGDLVEAPDITGKLLLDAERAAEAVGLGVRVETTRPHPTYREGAVASQAPSPGVEMKVGRSVAVVLSEGQDIRTVPPLGGLNARQAQLDAEAEGFTVSEIVETYTNRVERGRVVGTDPGPGAVAPAGTPVKLLVSLGPRPLEFIMPSLVGRTPEEARLIAEGLGLVVRAVKYERGDGRFLRDVVVVQDPAAGSHVVEGEGVTLRVGRG